MRSLPVAAGVLLLACTHEYAYVPTTNATATVRGRPAAEYPIPPADPQGDVRVASFGITEVQPKDRPDQNLRALHLRVAIADNGATPWTFDTREQRLDLSGRGPLAPAFASADPGSPPPVVTVDPHGKRTVDLFFLLPDDLQDAEDLPEFDASWTLHAGSAVVAERTPFERLIVEPDDYYGGGWYGDGWYGYGYGPDDYYWGPPYWMDPALGYGPYGYFGGGLYIRRGPHFAHGGFRGAHRGFHGGFHGAGHGGGGRR